MAIWQFSLRLVPLSKLTSSDGRLSALTEELLNDLTLDLSAVDEETLLKTLNAALPEARSWSNNVRIWGAAEHDDVQVYLDEGRIGSVQIRLDVSHLSFALIEGICAIADQFRWALIDEDRAIIEPSRDAIVGAIKRSRAGRFVRNPERFFDELS